MLETTARALLGLLLVVGLGSNAVTLEAAPTKPRPRAAQALAPAAAHPRPAEERPRAVRAERARSMLGLCLMLAKGAQGR